MIRVLIVDDQEIVCQGLTVIINAGANTRVVGTAYNGAQAIEAVVRLQPDLVLMDLKMPGINGIQATRAIREQFPAIPVLVLTTYDDDEWVMDALRAGASGYLLKDAGRVDLIAAIEGTIEGRTHIDPGVAGKIVAQIRQQPLADMHLIATLTERERAVLTLLASGMTNAAIGDRLGLAEGTVRNHISLILTRLGVHDRAQATAIAWRSGLMRSGI